MKSPALRTQVVAVMGLIVLYAVGVGLSYWIEARAHSRLEDAFRRELGALANIPRLRDELRQLEQASHQYLLTGDRRLLERRRQALDKVRRISGELSEQAADGPEQAALRELDSRLASYLAEQGQWVSSKESGQLGTAEALALTRKPRSFDGLTELVGRITADNVAAMDRRRLAVRRASAWTLGLILAMGLSAAGLVAFILSRFMVGPIARLRDYARGWVLGSDWSLQTPHASPEVSDLIDCLREMTGRLNRQYESEHELGQLKGRLVSMASHEFGNALSIIGGLTTVLEDSEPESPSGARAKHYEILKSNIRSLSLAALNLLEMGRLENGKFNVDPRTMELKPLLEDTLKRLAPLAERKRHEVSLELPGSLPPVRGDPQTLSLVATNLLANAIKYTPEGGRISVGIEGEPNGTAVVYFQDSGIGLSEEQKERILAGSLRSEAGKRTAKGFGVGLDLVRSVLEAHGTSLQVESEAGKGSRFSFSLPSAAA